MGKKWKWGKAGCDDCCTATPCLIWSGNIKPQYEDFDFDDDWDIYNDISQEDMDLTAVSGGTVIINKAEAASEEAVVVFTMAAESDMPSGQNIRLQLAASSGSDYIYADLSRSGGEIVVQLGFREEDGDSNLGAPVGTGLTKLAGDFALCWDGDKATFAVNGVTIKERSDVLRPFETTDKFGFESTDWSNSAVTPLPIAVRYSDGRREDVEGFEGCPFCEGLGPSDTCSCPWTQFVKVSTLEADFLIEYVDTTSPNKPAPDCNDYCQCNYEGTFDIAPCEVRTGFFNVTNAVKVKINWYNANCAFNGGAVKVLKFTFLDAGNNEILVRDNMAPYCGPFGCGPACTEGCNSDYSFLLDWNTVPAEQVCDRVHFRTEGVLPVRYLARLDIVENA